jgi:DNA-binding MarR family transcriptional regulator
MDDAARPSTEAVSLVKRLYDSADGIESAVVEVLAELNLSKSQAGVLWALDPSNPPMSMRELARKLHFDPSNITLISDRLVAVGLVERRAHPSDGRQRILALTPEGLRVWAVLIGRLQRRLPVFLLSEREQAQLNRLLAKAEAKCGVLPET